MDPLFEDSESDNCSLFGSPSPPTVSELPALPGSPAASCADLAKNVNVGTIALPSSHIDAELVVSLPASPPRDCTHRPSEQQPQSGNEHRQPRVSSSNAAPKKGTQRRKQKSKPAAASNTSTPGPSIAFPTTSEGIPANFLRNQDALLGLAGLVARVRPANLPKRGKEGTTAANPIIIEEDPGRTGKSSSRQTPDFASGQSNASDIADALISQGNIFPVLRSLLPFLNAGAGAGQSRGVPRNGWRRGRSIARDETTTQGAAHPAKKRKLKRVPAGAKDWDVPYPFAANEGPSSYLQSWEKEKAKSLMVELNTLVRQAVEKATSTEGSRASESQHAPTRPIDTSHSGIDFPAQLSPPPGMAPQTTATGFEAMPMNFGQSCTSSVPPSASLFDNDPFVNLSANVQDSELDSFLGALNDAFNFPNFDANVSEFSSTPSASFSPTVTEMPSPSLSSSTRLSTPCDMTQASATVDKGKAPSQMPDFSLEDLANLPIAIDPSLMNLQWPDPMVMSSFGLPDLFAPETSLAAPAAEVLSGNPSFSIASSTSQPAVEHAPYSAEQPVFVESTQCPANVAGPENTSVVGNLTRSAGPNIGTITDAVAPAETPNIPVVSLLENASFRPTMSSNGKKLDRQDVLRQARVRREQLARELARTRIELWETTIEQGVLANIAKDKELSSSSASTGLI